MISVFLLLSIVFSVSAKNEEYMGLGRERKKLNADSRERFDGLVLCYTGYKVYNIKLESQVQADRLNELKRDVIDFWRNPSLKHNVVGRAMVPASHTDWFEERLNGLNIPKDIFIEDVYEHLKQSEKSLTRTIRNDDVDRAFDFNGYYRYDEILTHLNSLQEIYSNSSINIVVEEFGTTDNGRSLVYLRISNSDIFDENKPIVVIESGIVPREWITIPAALNVVNRIVGNDTQHLDKADWIVVPVANPDGYEYTFTNLRLWTKNLSTRSNLGFICPGVNINRNFDVEWGISDSSSSPCSHIYAGIEPFSEPESQMIKHLIETYNERIKLYVTLQNSRGFISYPWQYERAASGMFRQHLFLGFDMIEAMNDDYILDVGWSALGDRASGTGSDFAQKNGVLYSLNIDIVQRGEDGVNVPENEIVDVIEDVWRALNVAVNTVV